MPNAEVVQRGGFRHSIASLEARRSRGSSRSLIVAFAANLFVAAAKLAAGLITGLAALLAEAAHSLADSTNEAKYAARPSAGPGGRRMRSTRSATAVSAFCGRSSRPSCRSWSAWPFLVGLAVNDLIHGNIVGEFLVAWIVLGIAALADGTALVQTMRQARREAALWERVNHPLPAAHERAHPPCAGGGGQRGPDRTWTRRHGPAGARARGTGVQRSRTSPRF